MKEYAERKEIYLVMALLGCFVIACAIASIILSKSIEEIKETANEPVVCVPIIREDYYGDVYTLHCVKESIFKEATKEEKAIENVL